jgi:hypothetical protein
MIVGLHIHWVRLRFIIGRSASRGGVRTLAFEIYGEDSKGCDEEDPVM